MQVATCVAQVWRFVMPEVWHEQNQVQPDNFLQSFVINQSKSSIGITWYQLFVVSTTKYSLRLGCCHDCHTIIAQKVFGRIFLNIPESALYISALYMCHNPHTSSLKLCQNGSHFKRSASKLHCMWPAQSSVLHEQLALMPEACKQDCTCMAGFTL